MDDFEGGEREEFRKQLSELTFEELIELKQNVGIKMFKETVTNKKEGNQKIDFKRTCIKRPREMSSKIPVSTFRNVVPVKLKEEKVSRDPRFENACGKFSEKIFNKTYDFIKDVRINEKDQLYEQLKKETDEETKKNIKLLIQRIENRERAEQKKTEKVEKEKAERVARKDALKEGKKPYFYKKSVKQVINLIDNYESLKKSGKVTKHIERKIKSKKAQDLRKNDACLNKMKWNKRSKFNKNVPNVGEKFTRQK